MTIVFEIIFGIMFGIFVIIEGIKTLLICSAGTDEEPEISPDVLKSMYS